MGKRTGFRAVKAGLGASLRQDINERYVYTQFRGPFSYTDGIGGAPGTADTDVNTLMAGGYGWNVRLEQISTNGTAAVGTTNDGLLLLVDSSSNDGLELNLGRTQSASDTTVNTNSLGAFTIGTDAPFFLRVKLDIGDVSAADQIAVGFSVGSYPADGAIAIYTDMAALNVDAGNIMSESRLNSGTAVATDSTQNVADAGQPVLEIRVSGSGRCQYLIDGAAPTTQIATFTFDDADVVHAFVSILVDAEDLDPQVTVMEWESGFLASRGIEFDEVRHEEAQNLYAV